MNHTPTPWEAGEKMKHGNLPSYGIRAGRFIIGETFGLNAETEAQAEANAEFIVTACNAWNNIEALEARIAELKAGAK